jgi:predicted permease
MRTSSRTSTASHERISFRKALVVAQVALSLVLLVGALLFGRSLSNLLTLDSGFRQEGVLLASVNAQRLGLPPVQRPAFFHELQRSIQAAPGVQLAAQTFIVPIGGGGWNNNIFIDENTTTERKKHLSNFNRVGEGYFRTMGTPLLAGRDFAATDTLSSTAVAIVNQAFAKKLLDGANPVGVGFSVESAPGEIEPKYEIVGLVQDSKYQSLRDEFEPTAYLPMTQEKEPSSDMAFVIRTAAPPSSMIPIVKSAISSVNDDASLRFEVFSERIRESLRQEQLMATLSGFFGFLATLLATLGLYGMLSYTVTQRRGEIGIRMVLGADRQGVVRMILREASILLLIGLVIGTAVSLAVAKTADTLLYGLAARDPLTIAAAVAGLASIALAASYIPARRAANLEPGTVLKEE